MIRPMPRTVRAAPPTSPTSIPPTHCAVRLRAAMSNLARQLRAALPPDGISVAKLSVLGQLHRLGPLTPSELAQRERVKLQSLTRLLAELEADGWVQRLPHPLDGRQSLLSLTRLGAKLLAADVHRREASLVEAIGARLTAREQARLLAACALIDRLADGLAAGVADAASATPADRLATGRAAAPTRAPPVAGGGR
jgi:DNA-binding MarR family transcriptional regulator